MGIEGNCCGIALMRRDGNGKGFDRNGKETKTAEKESKWLPCVGKERNSEAKDERGRAEQGK